MGVVSRQFIEKNYQVSNCSCLSIYPIVEVSTAEPIDYFEMLIDRLEILDSDGKSLSCELAGPRARVVLCQLVKHVFKFSSRCWYI